MKIKKGIFAGMAVMALLFGFVLAGCATTKYIQVETETTKAIYEAATEIVRSQEGSISAGALLSGLGNIFPGLKASPVMAFQVDLITVSYQGASYMIKCTMGRGETIQGTGGSATTVGATTIVTSINSVYTSIPDPDQ